VPNKWFECIIHIFTCLEHFSLTLSALKFIKDTLIRSLPRNYVGENRNMKVWQVNYNVNWKFKNNEATKQIQVITLQPVFDNIAVQISAETPAILKSIMWFSSILPINTGTVFKFCAQPHHCQLSQSHSVLYSLKYWPCH
jgi:hypothetical protein